MLSILIHEQSWQKFMHVIIYIWCVLYSQNDISWVAILHSCLEWSLPLNIDPLKFFILTIYNSLKLSKDLAKRKQPIIMHKIRDLSLSNFTPVKFLIWLSCLVSYLKFKQYSESVLRLQKCLCFSFMACGRKDLTIHLILVLASYTILDGLYKTQL